MKLNIMAYQTANTRLEPHNEVERNIMARTTLNIFRDYDYSSVNCPEGTISFYPSEIAIIAEKYPQGIRLSSWKQTFQFSATKAGDNFELELTTLDRSQISQLTVDDITAVQVKLDKRSSHWGINEISLPVFLRDKLAWALGFTRKQYVSSLDYLNDHAKSFSDTDRVERVTFGDMTVLLVYDFTKTNELWKSECRYTFGGRFPSRDGVIKLLKTFALNPVYGINPIRIEWVLNRIEERV